MINRLAMLDRQYTKDTDVKRGEFIKKVKKRDAKIQEKRDATKKELKKKQYRKEQYEKGKPGKYDK